MTQEYFGTLKRKEKLNGERTTNRQQGFCVRRAEVQNSTVVFQLNIRNNINFCASISRPNAKPRTLVVIPPRPQKVLIVEANEKSHKKVVKNE